MPRAPDQTTLATLSEASRAEAHRRWLVLRVHLEDGVPLTRVAAQCGIPHRTLQRWLARYLDPSGRARLSYQQAAALFSEASGGATLHQLRHSALTHDAEKGTGTPMLMARSGHTSVRSLAKYARVSAEALARHQVERDPARRR
jgi:integrase